LDALKAKQDAQKNQQGGQAPYRKHNSPDYNKYRAGDKANPRLRISPSQDEKELQRPGRKEEEEPRVKRSKELVKTSSQPSLDLKQLAEEESEDYKKLHEKLSLIENKIADMKRHVQKKR
jgi:hypothetical protein